MASKHFNAEMGYVALSRHRENMVVAVDQSRFKNLDRLSYQFNQSNAKGLVVDFGQKYALSNQKGYEINI